MSDVLPRRWPGMLAVAALVTGGLLAGAAPAAAALPAGCTQAGLQVTCSYGYTGAEQTFVVPDGVTSVDITAVGAAGGPGSGTQPATPGGRGARVSGTVGGLAPGSTLYVEVGQVGATARSGSFNGGGAAARSAGSSGSGGGASDVRTATGGADPAANGLASRLIVAGAGGGGGFSNRTETDGGVGGDAGADGRRPTENGSAGKGGRAGTATAGGAGGAGGVTNDEGEISNGAPGTNGGPGRGGNGANDRFSGGGGGGGLFGGGGGGSSRGPSGIFLDFATNGGGGGGGSSLVPPGGSGPVVTTDPASVTITYTALPIADTVIAVSGGDQTAVTGSAFPQPLVAAVRDSVADQPVPGAPVTFTVTEGSATFPDGSTTATVPTGADGTASSPVLTAGPNPGPVAVTATTAGVSGGATFTATVTAPPPVASAITATSESGQSAAAGQAFAAPLVATVTDAAQGVPVPGSPVTFTVTGGSATFPGGATAIVTADAQGRASAPTLTAGQRAGAVTITATTPGVTGSASFTATVTAARADLSIALTAPTTATVGTPFAVTLTVRNTGPSPAQTVGTGLTVPAGLRITGAGGGAVTDNGRAVGFVARTLAAGAEVSYTVQVTADPSARGTRTLAAATGSLTGDPSLRNNTASRTVTIR